MAATAGWSADDLPRPTGWPSGWRPSRWPGRCGRWPTGPASACTARSGPVRGGADRSDPTGQREPERRNQNGGPQGAGPLTPRELSVLTLVADGRTNRQVGSELFISEKTVSVHLSRVMAKLGAASRTEAVNVAYTRGLLTPPAVPRSG